MPHFSGESPSPSRRSGSFTQFVARTIRSGMMLKDYFRANEQIKWLIFHGVNSSTVFTNVSHGDDPIRNLTQLPSDKQYRIIRGTTVESSVESASCIASSAPWRNSSGIYRSSLYGSSSCLTSSRHFGCFRLSVSQTHPGGSRENPKQMRLSESKSRSSKLPYCPRHPFSNRTNAKKWLKSFKRQERPEGGRHLGRSILFTERRDDVIHWIASVIIKSSLDVHVFVD